MHLIGQQSRVHIQKDKIMKIMLLSVAVGFTVAMAGCASKPQINNSSRYAMAPNYYTVRSGDTLSGIAMRYGLDYISIAEMNDIAPPYRIYVNQSLRLKKGSSPRTVSTQVMAQPEQIKRQTIALPTTQPVTPVTQPTTTSPSTNTTVTSVAPNSSLRWIKPNNGPVIQGFNLANNVKGIRYGGNQGDPIYAAADGQVVYAADGLKEYGNLVLIKHIDGYISAYAHNSKMLVKSGDNVTAGQKIAEMGSTGASQVMLEFQIRLDGKPINPINLLPK
ncbi:peptidoglycan DD-metalloendopeptidase family protein [Acinetobacter pittii]|uniref:peptidoglycan DD-metalloendopeptidase family protein n=1 Tax=Acinetobacter calcoaceticus/baumannii complex TaxID=909768 RepID=UPI000584EA80|nr:MULTISPECIES: peptidoglycan DD-metalloendopeptidase family protein [Acinetobacter calcoaceticus/baumannii complex]KIE86745.1 peptidoglycan-binding protein [Acinetobacter pittii]KQE87717.1 peptidoglycan-binding protein [Acinetobacter lactucae]MBJ8477975.1 peptidoglycan DD-metalloendopeptidase family protein [Acinetobacter pittii]MBN6538103.1 peptidoglycan DD-metalloendopeptidase family protein [Acinetobacter pittii]MCU4340449.1 peptidoglycan DD-metalloendopeptidase family protein [Acinetobac